LNDAILRGIFKRTPFSEFLLKFGDLKTKTFKFISCIISKDRILISVLDISKFPSIWHPSWKDYKKKWKVDTQMNSKPWVFVELWGIKIKNFRFKTLKIPIDRIFYISLRFFKIPLNMASFKGNYELNIYNLFWPIKKIKILSIGSKEIITMNSLKIHI